MATNEHILVVEDDDSLAQWICDYLEQHDYQVTHAVSGTHAVTQIQAQTPDLVLLDIMLPGLNGFDVCKEVRNYYKRPILMMTASGDEVDEVLGLELGADDYITKPVKPRVLLARIKALLRRDSTASSANELFFGTLHINNNAKSVVVGKENIAISAHEFEVLWLLATNAGKVLLRTELVSKLRGIDYDGFDRSIDIRISRLRKKLGDDSDNPQKIKTIWGKGYLFAADAW